MKRKIIILFAVVSVFIFSCCDNRIDYDSIALLTEPPFSDSNRDGFWEIENPVNPFPDGKLLKDHIELCRLTGADSQIVVYQGKIISEWYSDRCTLPVYAMSSTKIVASLLVGILVDSGRISSYNDKITKYIPEWSGGYRDDVTIEHLLTHTSGLKQAADKGESVGFETDKTGFVLLLKPEWKPGVKYSYSNEGVQLLEPLIERTSETKTHMYAQKVLFQPLGMMDTQLNVDQKGHAWVYADMKTSPRDMARLGMLMLNGGIWGKQGIISEYYIQRAVAPSKINKEMGYLWWILYSGKGKKIGFYASGYLNTDIYVFPEKELVIVRTQGPRNGYTGANESGDYFKRALKIFEKLIK